MGTLSFIFLGLSLVFIFASVITGSKYEFFGIKSMKLYYYTGATFMGLTLLLMLTLENGLSVEALILPVFLIILMITLFKINMFIQKKVEETIGEISFLSLISRIKNFINLIKKRS